MKHYAKFFLVLASAMSIAAVMSSQTLAQGADPMAEIAAQLGIEPSQMQTCLPATPPTPGQRPSDAEHAAFVSCLQGLNPSLTAAQIDAAMEAMKDMPPPPRKN